MQLGAFSNSLSVKDIKASKGFYEKLGFILFAGNTAEGWVILKNGETIIGLFQDMFDRNMMTFNPGWDQNASNVDPFEDVRSLQKKLQQEGIEVINPADETGEGPANFTVIDPDGNPILIDQHR